MTFSWSPAVKEPLESDIWAEKFDDFMRNWVVTGLAPSDGGSGHLTIASGTCWIDGWRVVTTGEDYDMSGKGDDDYYVYIELTKDGQGKISTVSTTDYTTPQTEDIRILIGIITIVSALITNVDDERQYDPFETTLIRLMKDVSLSAWQHASDLSKIDGADLYGASVPYSALTLADSIVNADINTGAAIAYSKLNLTGSILNADINASANIVESKLSFADLGGHAHAATGGSGTQIDHGSLGGLGDHDHSLYPRKGTAEEITQIWTYSSGIDMNQSKIDFYDETQQRGRMVGYGGEMRIWTKSCSLKIQDLDNSYCMIHVETSEFGGGMLPTTHEAGNIGSITKAYYQVYAWKIKYGAGGCSAYSDREDMTDLRAIKEYRDTDGNPLKLGEHGDPVWDARTIPSYLRGKEDLEIMTKKGNPEMAYLSMEDVTGWFISILKKMDQEDIKQDKKIDLVISQMKNLTERISTVELAFAMSGLS